MRRGFTLIELLVSIGIIAVLLGILLPALAHARSAAYAVGCQKNLSQLMSAFLAFAHDHEGRLPGNYFDVRNPEPYKRAWLLNADTPWQAAPQDGTIFKYVKDVRAYRCPAEPEEIPGSGKGSNGRFDYSSFPQLSGAPIEIVKLDAELRNDDGTVDRIYTPVIIEEAPDQEINKTGHFDAAFCVEDCVSSVHRGGGHIATIDGSVHWMQRKGTARNMYIKAASGNWLRIGGVTNDVFEGWGTLLNH
jgi:prepilin-type N-terminal cleavage/methylation domain-containing protein